jgi:undecaprenyl-diphosphatase
MSLLQAVILGIVQGLTEFLPVSSSGHLVLFKEFFEVSEVPILFDVILHVATLLVVVIVFRSRIWMILRSVYRWLRRRNDEADATNLRLAWVILLASVVTGAMGVFIGELGVNRYPVVVSVLFIITGLALIATRFVKPRGEYADVGARTALITGFAQGLGVFPGISRSGITIAASLFSGLGRERAGEFSFLLSIPAITGALALSLRDLGDLTRFVSAGAILAGAGASFLVGLAALVLLLRVVRRGRLYLFSIYLVPLGITGIILFSR